MSNVDNNEVDKFSRLAKNWWNPNGELKTLHQVNPLRLKFIQKYTDLDSKNIIDIGCGGGILTLYPTEVEVYLFRIKVLPF